MTRTDHAAQAVIEIQGHRGARGVMPENTLPGFAYALSIGVSKIELDVMLSADGVVVATHNPKLEPATTRDRMGQWLANQGLAVHALSFDALRQYDVGGMRPGSGYGARFPDQAFLNGVHIPSLSEVIGLTIASSSTAVLNIEIKSDPEDLEQVARRDQLVDQVIRVIRTHAFEARVQLQSFDWSVMERISARAPDLPLAYLTLMPYDAEKGTVYPGSPWTGRLDVADFDGNVPALVAAAGGSRWVPNFKDLGRKELEIARSLGLRVDVWTVNEPSDIARMISLGVDGIITDYPSRAQRMLLDHGLGWQ